MVAGLAAGLLGTAGLVGAAVATAIVETDVAGAIAAAVATGEAAAGLTIGFDDSAVAVAEMVVAGAASWVGTAVGVGLAHAAKNPTLRMVVTRSRVGSKLSSGRRIYPSLTEVASIEQRIELVPITFHWTADSVRDLAQTD